MGEFPTAASVRKNVADTEEILEELVDGGDHTDEGHRMTPDLGRETCYSGLEGRFYYVRRVEVGWRYPSIWWSRVDARHRKGLGMEIKMEQLASHGW